MFLCRTVFALFMYSTKPLMPPEYAKFSLLPVRWSISSDLDAVIEERQFANALGENLEVVFDQLEGLDGDARKCTSVPRRLRFRR